tara:strand:- start:814 stop:1536 length:723 start_codon:yes stop_codon:yes gene_type:complete
MEESKILYKNFVPLDLENLYEQIISCESGLGISINSELQNIIKDTVNVFLNASVIPFKEVREGIPILGKLVSYEGVDIDFRNLEFHDNEEVNYDTVSRVFDQIYKLQETIFNIIVSQDDNEDEVNVIEVDQTDEIIINQYTRGGEFILTDTGEDYVGFYHVHPDKGYMVGPLHIDSPHAYLTPIVNVNVTPVEVVESVPDVIESPQPRYSSHGMTSNDSRNRRQNTSGGNSSSGSSGGSY